jgi:ribosomal protein S18 acetylase RimI-like enzyme
MAGIRKATVQDRAELESCFAELQRFERGMEPNRAEPEAIACQYVDELLADCATHRGAVFVAEALDRIIGFACVLAETRSSDLLEQHRDHAYVTDLYVREGHRGEGTGAELMRAAEAHALANGAARIRVGVLAVNDIAHRLYRKLGYRDYEVILEKVLNADPLGDSR